jgi:hypothetical protein
MEKPRLLAQNCRAKARGRSASLTRSATAACTAGRNRSRHRPYANAATTHDRQSACGAQSEQRASGQQQAEHHRSATPDAVRQHTAQRLSDRRTQAQACQD